MFRITIHFLMGDTTRITHDNPEAVIASLKMDAVSSIEIYSTKGD